MTPGEHEILDPVDLCDEDGRSLHPSAKGWSRHILHRANLAGRWGRTKRWDYWAIQAEHIIVAVTVADIDYAGLVTLDWIEPGSHRSGGRSVTIPLGRGVDLPDEPATGRLDFNSRNLGVSIVYGDGSTHLLARWTEKHGASGSLSATVAEPEGHESLNVVIPWSSKQFQFTSKHQARPANGSVTVDGRTIEIGGSAGEAWGILDIGRGRWPYRTTWNWGGGSGYAATGQLVGLQVGGKWTDGTGFTENGVIIDGSLVKIGEDLEWIYNWDDPMAPWTVRSADGMLDVTLAPVHDRHSNLNLGVLKNEVHQVFARWSGCVPDGTGGSLSITDMLGFA
ncbi:MAG: DUF2804 domain-containing protein, partial [Acidimicrobiia bacterium]